MRRFAFILLLAVIASLGNSWAQQVDTTAAKWLAPDYARIAETVKDVASPYYYPRLFDRYQRGDTTLTAEDFRYLYYGYPNQPGYKPLLASPYADSLATAFGKKTSPTANDYLRVVGFARNILKEAPFSLRDLNVLAFAYNMLDEPEKARIEMFKVRGIYDAIRATGTGLTEKTPWYVTYMEDAEDVLNLLGARYTKLIIVSRTVEYAPVYNLPDKRQKGYYFDYSEVYKRRPDYLDGIKTKRKFEVNPQYNPKSKLNVLPK